MGHIPLTKLKRTSTFRKIAFGSWRSAGDPTVYSEVEVDTTNLQAFTEKCKRDYGVKITPVHAVAKALSTAIANHPEINGMIRGGRIYLRKSVDMFFQVNIPSEDGLGKPSLSGTTVCHMTEKTIVEIANELTQAAQKIRKNQDAGFKKTMDTIKFIPWCLMRWFLNLSSWLIYGLNLDLSRLGLPRDPFGSAMVTNVGSLGVAKAWVPLVPYSRVPLILCVGAIRPRPWVIDGRVEVRPVVSIGVTFDHRLMDGVHAAQMCRDVEAALADPDHWLMLSSKNEHGHPSA
jgi:pyruvate dehydrogenase E2 component (dihydrolipoamide acetyltransferase)